MFSMLICYPNQKMPWFTLTHSANSLVFEKDVFLDDVSFITRPYKCEMTPTRVGADSSHRVLAYD